MTRLSEKTAIVLGAAGRKNMGQIIARRFATEGANVVVGGRNTDELRTLAEDINGAYATCDVTNESDVSNLVATAIERFGGLDIAVNATGKSLLKPFVETSRQDLEEMVELQFVGPFLFFQAVVKSMNRNGSIIQISSATATIMLEDHAAYMGTKAGTDHVIRCIADAFGDRGIRANSIAPGFTPTPMTAKAVNKGIAEAFAREYPLGRVGTSEDIAKAAVWLASDECFMTGQVLQVNGGVTLRRNPRNSEIIEFVKKAKGIPKSLAQDRS